MREWVLLQTGAVCLGFAIDFIVGDPHCLPHPVRWMGALIAALERRLRRGKSPRSDFWRGLLLMVVTALLSAILPGALLAAAWAVSPWLYFALDSLMCWQILAARQLVRESALVQRALEEGDIEKARHAVSMIVGRDTKPLSAEGICKAAVETVAENASDGVIAPMCWMLLLGAAGGFFYKAVNTMDSMVGYKNEKYLWFGRAAAKADDAVNFLPARLSALLMVLMAPLCGLDGKNAWKVFRRDRFKHQSPNSAQTEAACAGALGVELAGDAWYGGVLHKKDRIGDPLRPVEAADIARAGRLMYAAAAAMLLIILVVRGAVLLLC